jgi:hypothetical protein
MWTPVAQFGFSRKNIRDKFRVKFLEKVLCAPFWGKNSTGKNGDYFRTGLNTPI